MQLKIKQVVSIVDNLVFRNSLVAMRLKLTTSDLPAFYNIKVHLYNEFVMHMKQLKVDIDVSLQVHSLRKVESYLLLSD